MFTKEDTVIAEKSYQRCIKQINWIKDFYDILINSSPEIPPYFTKTNFAKQIVVLQSGVSFIFMQARGVQYAEMKMEEIGEMHNRNNLDLKPHLYPFWIDSLIKSVEIHDPKFDAEIESSWRKVLGKVTDDIIKQY
mgnify:CR=1 FL=1